MSQGPGTPGAAGTRGLRRVACSRLPTRSGVYTVVGYENAGSHHLALVLGDIGQGGPPLVRIHSECLTGDVFGSLRCDCGAQLEEAMRRLEEEGRGVLLYLRQEGRGIGLCNKLRAYELQDLGLDTVEANERLGFPPDLREYSVAAEMLRDLGVGEVRLLTNNPRKEEELGERGVRVTERIPLLVPPTPENRRYLATKRRRLGHLLEEITG